MTTPPGPFKGDARYWSVRAGGRHTDNGVWEYPDPPASASWLRDHLAIDWDTADAWLDEDERVESHLRDPYHRVDVWQSTRHVRVLLGDVTIAETSRPMLLSETGLPNRYYLLPGDVHREVLTESSTRSVCPYKGTATY